MVRSNNPGVRPEVRSSNCSRLSTRRGRSSSTVKSLNSAVVSASLAQRLWPRLTTVRHPVEQVSREATEILIRYLNGETPEFNPETIHSELVIRESTGPLLD